MKLKFIYLPLFLLTLSVPVSATRNKNKLASRLRKFIAIMEISGPLGISLADGRGNTLLHLASSVGAVDLFEVGLFNAGGRIDRQNNHGRTPLHLAARAGFLLGVKRLVEEGANLWVRDLHGNFPLHYAVESGDLGVVAHILQRTDSPVSEINSQKQNILHIAAKESHIELVHLILKQPLIYPNARDKFGQTALHYAVAAGAPKIVELLFSHPLIYVNPMDNHGHTPFALALATGQQEIAKLLFSRGARIGPGLPKEAPSLLDFKQLREFVLVNQAQKIESLESAQNRLLEENLAQNMKDEYSSESSAESESSCDDVQSSTSTNPSPRDEFGIQRSVSFDNLFQFFSQNEIGSDDEDDNCRHE